MSLKNNSLLVLCMFICFLWSSTKLYSQDYLRVNIGGNLKSGEDFVKEFTLDINRTKSKKESEGIYFIYHLISENSNKDQSLSYSLKPSADINLGSDVESSRNNLVISIDNTLERWMNKYFVAKVDLGPEYNSTRTFDEELFYWKLAPSISYIKGKAKMISFDGAGTPYPNPVPITKTEKSLSIGLDYSLGQRFSDNGFDNGINTFSPFINGTWRLKRLQKEKKDKSKKTKPKSPETIDTFVLSIKYNHKRLFQESELLTSKSSVDQLEVSLDIGVNKNLTFNIKYEIGDDNPIYNSIHTIEGGLTIPIN